MDEVQEAAVVEANLEALPGDPSAQDVLSAIDGYSDNAVNIALKRTGGTGGGGIDFGQNTGTELSIYTEEGDIELSTENAVTLTAEEGSRIHVNATPGDILVEATDALTLKSNTGDAALTSNNGDLELGANGDIEVSAGAALVFYATTLGFFGEYPGTLQPVIPASPTVQDVVDALVALGLVTQAA